jgi:hypothetical protein
MTEKRKFNPISPTLIMGGGGRPTYLKMAKNVKSLIIFAPDCRYYEQQLFAVIYNYCIVFSKFYTNLHQIL